MKATSEKKSQTHSANIELFVEFYAYSRETGENFNVWENTHLVNFMCPRKFDENFGKFSVVSIHIYDY